MVIRVLSTAAVLVALGISGLPDARAHVHGIEGETVGVLAEMSGDGMSAMPMEGMKGMAGMMRPDMAPPVGVMGGMSPKQNSFMLALQYMQMRMDGNRDGTSDVSTAGVLSQFPVAPTDMDMYMLMGSAMYGITDDISVMAMAPYIWRSMDHVNRMGAEFTTDSDGIGDVRVVGGYDVFKTPGHTVKLTGGVSLPTGSTNQKDDTPAGPNQLLPYPMQNGSGTFDLLPGITYTGRSDYWSWGGQLGGVIRFGENSDDYRLGNAFQGSVWGARKWADWVSTSLRVTGETVGNIAGADPRLNPMMVPTADPDRRAGEFVSVGLGVNFLVPSGILQGLGLSVEGVLPVYQRLDGPQLERDYAFIVGLRKPF